MNHARHEDTTTAGELRRIERDRKVSDYTGRHEA